jgi:uncharacterized membrane protein YkvA (DUF1232 family)
MKQVWSRFKKHMKQLKLQVYVLWFAYKDPRTPWYAKCFTGLVVAYAFSPIDLIPDFIPVLGYLDDLILVPLGISIALKMIPVPVLEASTLQAQARINAGKPKNWYAAGTILLLWLAVLAWVVFVLFK